MSWRAGRAGADASAFPASENVVITATNYRRVDPARNMLIAYVDLELQPSGLALHDCMIHRQGDTRWVSFSRGRCSTASPAF